MANRVMRHLLDYSCNLYTGFEDQLKMLNGGGLGLQCQLTPPWTPRNLRVQIAFILELHGTAFC